MEPTLDVIIDRGFMAGWLAGWLAGATQTKL